MTRDERKALTFSKTYGRGMMQIQDAMQIQDEVVLRAPFPPGRFDKRERRQWRRRAPRLYDLVWYSPAQPKAYSVGSSGGITLSAQDVYRLTQIKVNGGYAFALQRIVGTIQARERHYADVAYLLGQLTSQINWTFDVVGAIRATLQNEWPLKDAIQACREWHEVGSASMALVPFMCAWISEM